MAYYAQCPSCRGLTLHAPSCDLRHLSLAEADALRQQQFEDALRGEETKTLQRWAAGAVSPNRRATAAKILRERGL